MGCQQSHPWSQGVPGRICLDLEVMVCCSHGRVVKDTSLPTPLSDKGLSQDDWDEFVVERLTRIIKRVSPCCRDTALSVLTCGVYLCTCLARVERIVRHEVADWKDEFNKILDPLGVTATIKSHAFIVHNGNGKCARLLCGELGFRHPAAPPSLTVRDDDFRWQEARRAWCSTH